MTFLQPLWLAALPALAVPVVLHLRRHGRMPRVAVGSLAHVPRTSTVVPRARRIVEPLLLALRLLVLAATIGGLADPRSNADARRATGRQALVTSPVALAHPSLADSLASEGFAVDTIPAGMLWPALRAVPFTEGLVAVVEDPARAAGTRPEVGMPVELFARAVPRDMLSGRSAVWSGQLHAIELSPTLQWAHPYLSAAAAAVRDGSVDTGDGPEGQTVVLTDIPRTADSAALAGRLVVVPGPGRPRRHGPGAVVPLGVELRRGDAELLLTDSLPLLLQAAVAGPHLGGDYTSPAQLRPAFRDRAAASSNPAQAGVGRSLLLIALIALLTERTVMLVKLRHRKAIQA